MSILIESMEMPKSCPCELLWIGYDLYCSFVGEIPARVKEYYECCQNDTRPSWCPLSHVPPHGRLIDADKQDAQIEALIERHLHGYTKSTWDFVCKLRDILKRNPTVITAEEGE